MAEEPKVKAFTVGDKVATRKYGVGMIEIIEHVGVGKEKYAIYHVRLANGDVRHFVKDEIKAAS